MSGGTIPRALRDRLVTQAGYRCSYCRSSERLSGIELEIDHLWPVALGGSSDEANLAPACGPCNDYKQARVTAEDPASGQQAPLFNPRTQRWSEHFTWEEGGQRIHGLTPIGRATERALRLNREALLGARRYWIAAGWHPPTDDAGPPSQRPTVTPGAHGR